MCCFFSFPACNASASLTIHGFKNALFIITVSCKTLLWTKDSDTSKEVRWITLWWIPEVHAQPNGLVTQTSPRSWRQLDLPTELVSHHQPFSLYQGPLVILELFLKSIHYHSYLWTKYRFVQECFGFPEINVNTYLVLNKPLNVSCFLMLDGCSCW